MNHRLLPRYLDAWKFFIAAPHAEMMPAGIALLDAYNDPARAYHNTSHLEDVLAKLDWAKDAVAAEPEVLAMDGAARDRMFARIALALFYHDVIYDTKAKDNEEKSRRLFCDHARTFGMQDADIAAISRLIDITASHTNAAAIDEKIMADCDLAILGAGRFAFEAYDLGIRREYAHVPSPLYAAARKKILRHFLETPRLFKTEAFHAAFDAAARDNLARAVGPAPIAHKIRRLFKR